VPGISHDSHASVVPTTTYEQLGDANFVTIPHGSLAHLRTTPGTRPSRVFATCDRSSKRRTFARRRLEPSLPPLACWNSAWR